MAMKNPPHVGGLIGREMIEPLGLTVTPAAKVLGVGRQALWSLLNGTPSPAPVTRPLPQLSGRGEQ